MNTLRTLFAPLSYLRARNSQKLIWDWPLPALAAVILTVLLLVLPKPIPILAERGLIYWVNELLQILVGFYIAALAAVSSFGRASLDQIIEGDGVLLATRDEERKDKRLTRRAFLSLMFGYLSFLAIFLYCTGLVVSLLADNIHLVDTAVLSWLRPIFVFVYGFLFAQMLAITLVALFYLSDRINRQTPTALPPIDLSLEEQDP